MTKANNAWIQAMNAWHLSNNFTAADLCCAGETWNKIRIENEPKRQETWIALALLCETILEPVLKRYGPLEITYGFASPALSRQIPANTAPALDQHASCEKNGRGKLICKRLGAAVDFLIPNSSSIEVAIWIAENLPFDRLYFYGAGRPLHVSIGPENTKSLVSMLPGSTGRRIPRNIKVDWLKRQA